MSIISPRRLGLKAGRTVSALVAAGLTAGLLATVALAVPIDPILNINGPANRVQFAGQDLNQDDCVPGGAAVTAPELDWGQVNQTVQPVLKGTVCIQSNVAREARVVLEYRDNNDVLISRHPSNTALGNGSPLNTFNVNLTGPQVTSAAMNHVHIVLEERLPGAAWAQAGPTRFEDL